jgi:endonuclease/exonuclease/phosphatase family metal-dependent hydrolase
MQIEGFRNQMALPVFRAASYLTDPICKAHELMRRIHLVDPLHPDGNACANLARKTALLIGAVGCFALAVFTTLPGIMLRAVAIFLQTTPYFYATTDGQAKALPKDRTFSLLSWNICMPNGGYMITDGGVLPASFRIQSIIDKIVKKDADVNCLSEVFDCNTALALAEALKQKGYHHFYFNFGARAVGVPAGLFVASKYKISSPEFIEFPKEATVGRAAHVAKGVFGFNLESQGNAFARVFATHLQHSENPEFATVDEVEARKKQFGIIWREVQKVGGCAIVTGDLNAEPKEACAWHPSFQQPVSKEARSWGGDGFCSRLVGRDPASKAIDLDYTKVFHRTNAVVKEKLIKTRFDGDRFNASALSDHRGVLSMLSVA